jgi:hypothetical protein
LNNFSNPLFSPGDIPFAYKKPLIIKIICPILSSSNKYLVLLL